MKIVIVWLLITILQGTLGFYVNPFTSNSKYISPSFILHFSYLYGLLDNWTSLTRGAKYFSSGLLMGGHGSKLHVFYNISSPIQGY